MISSLVLLLFLFGFILTVVASTDNEQLLDFQDFESDPDGDDDEWGIWRLGGKFAKRKNAFQTPADPNSVYAIRLRYNGPSSRLISRRVWIPSNVDTIKVVFDYRIRNIPEGNHFQLQAKLEGEDFATVGKWISGVDYPANTTSSLFDQETSFLLTNPDGIQTSSTVRFRFQCFFEDITASFVKLDNIRLFVKGEVFRQIGQDIPGERRFDLWGGSEVNLSADGTIVAAGGLAHDADGAGDRSGHVRVFQYDVDDNEWIQVGQSINGAAAGDSLGTSLALASEAMIVAAGAPGSDEGGSSAGSVRVFFYNTESNLWEPMGDGSPLLGDTIQDSDFMGSSVAISSDGLIVAAGAPGRNSCESPGHIRVFGYYNSDGSSGNNWRQLGTDISGPFSCSFLGRSVALSADGRTVAAGAADTVYIYKYNLESMTWESTYNITGPTSFGQEVAMNANGTIVAVGAPRYRMEGGFGFGLTRVLQLQAEEGVWIGLGQDIEGEKQNELFGSSIDVTADGFTMAVGTSELSDIFSTGLVRVFDYDADTDEWVQQGPTLLGERRGDRMQEVAISAMDGNTLATGAIYGNRNQGSVKVYTRV